MDFLLFENKFYFLLNYSEDYSSSGTDFQSTQPFGSPKFIIESKVNKNKKNCCEKCLNNSLTSLKSYRKEDLNSKTAQMIKRKYSSIVSNVRKVGLQGRKPQVGSPLITEDLRQGDRYQCKVCRRTYLWKKSLVRHYKDLHPQDIELVK